MTTFVDTNIFVYSQDLREGRKRIQAAAIWEELAGTDDSLVSAQVASELANTLLRLWKNPKAVDDVIVRLDESMRVVHVTSSTVHLALEGVVRFGFSFHDAQIWASALEWDATLVLSEDFPDGLVADGVRFANPFAPGFDLEALLA